MSLSFAERMERARRLVILRVLSIERSGRLSDFDLIQELDRFGHKVSRREVRDLLRWLEGEDAVTLALPGGGVMLAEIARRGEEHLERRGPPIEGVDPPSRL